MQSRSHTIDARVLSILKPLTRAVVAFSLVFSVLTSLWLDHALAIPLGNLVNGGSITQGDKVFSNFSGGLDLQFGTFSPSGIGGIDVQGVTVAGMGGTAQHGLQFTGPFSTSGSGLSVLNYFIGYDVSVQNTTSQIIGLTTSLINPAVTQGGEILLSTEASRSSNGFFLGVGDATNTSPQSTLTFATAGLSSVRVGQELVLFSEGGTSTLGGVQTTFAQGGVTPPPGLIP
ncbi:MAG TPA: hypothetical protein VJ692_00045, partial [Nitrospiraceae bacterium]|nr:hypothetical protein [Nitrospiraceae bacterium]